ncbi:MAG: branched-chain amino acid transport system permease protein [Halothiobacillaceae bacterium]|nr:MAG: branched-chain amino acid transport system permease protein [Halothiobacillaceae bacterium]
MHPLFHQLQNDRRLLWIAFTSLAILLALLPFLADLGLGRSWVRILDFALLYIMLALGLNIVVGYAGLLDLGYVGFYAVGAYLISPFGCCCHWVLC